MPKMNYSTAWNITEAAPRLRQCSTNAMGLASIQPKSETGLTCMYCAAHLFESGYLERMTLRAGLCGGMSYKGIRKEMIDRTRTELITEGYISASLLWWIFSPLIRKWIGHFIDQWLLQDYDVTREPGAD